MTSLPVAGNKITLNNTSKRPNSADWTRDITCASIIHETLHLTGLVDEYRERDSIEVRTGWWFTGAKTSVGLYNCRDFNPTANIMANEAEALEDSFALMGCVCVEKSCASSAKIVDSVGKGKLQCPSGFEGHWEGKMLEPARATLEAQPTAAFEKNIAEAGWIVGAGR